MCMLDCVLTLQNQKLIHQLTIIGNDEWFLLLQVELKIKYLL
jgi:hypothetical protein